MSFLLPVTGGVIHYQLRGSGPLLLLLQGGDGDADAMGALSAQLDDRYTLLSYDRRGLSRSPSTAPTWDLRTHAEDASRLLTTLTNQPALVFGTSLGADVGLELLARSPDQIRLLVAHEPPLSVLLPDGELARQQLAVEEAFRDDGLRAALPKFARLAGFDLSDAEPGVALPAPKPDRIANLTAFLTHDAPAVRQYQPDVDALRAHSDKLMLAAGTNSKTLGVHRSTDALAQLLGTDVTEFPGGHIGWLLHPTAFAAHLAQALAHRT